MIFRIHKNIKQFYYAYNALKLLIPNFLYRKRLAVKLTEYQSSDREYINQRVRYYNRLEEQVGLPEWVEPTGSLKLGKKHNTYFFDSYAIARYFNPKLKVHFLFGDILHIPEVPSVVKSRPIDKQNQNAVLMKLNKVRHFIFTNDKNRFEDKKNMLIGRGGVGSHKPKRVAFYNQYFDHPMCDLGQINKNTPHDHWYKKKISIEAHLKYKFVLCLEGIDVSTNLKWVMSSNSIAVMPKPTMETWFMEGTLIPNYHYIEIKEDYSDLEERLNYYINHPDACLEIIKNANAYVSQFKDLRRERLISLLVLERYFKMTQQIKSSTV